MIFLLIPFHFFMDLLRFFLLTPFSFINTYFKKHIIPIPNKKGTNKIQIFVSSKGSLKMIIFFHLTRSVKTIIAPFNKLLKKILYSI